MQLKPIFDNITPINQSDYFCLPNGFSDEELVWLDNLKNLYSYIGKIDSEFESRSYKKN